MSIKHILFPFTNEKDGADLSICVLRLAKHLGAHIAGYYEDELGPVYMAPVDMIMPVVDYTAFVDSLQNLRIERESKARHNFERAATVIGLPLVAAMGHAGGSAKWHGSQAGMANMLTDMVVTKTPGDQDITAPWNVIEQALFTTRQRVLAIPLGVTALHFARPMIAWNGSAEAASAVEKAVPLLKPGARVTVVQVGDNRRNRIPAQGAVDYLACHGFPTELQSPAAHGGNAGKALLHHAETTHADSIIMGAFTHSRTREALLGGVTDYMLRHSTLPLLMAH